jgi:hypothetical protein
MDYLQSQVQSEAVNNKNIPNKNLPAGAGRLTPHNILGNSRESNDVYKNVIAMVGQGNVAIDKMANDMASNMSFLQKLFL